MAHRIGRNEDIAAALIRLAAEDLDSARRDVAATDRREQRLHRVRQRLKRVRTILRILEPAFGARAAGARRRLAAAARLLAHARDADVAAENARTLAAAHAEGIGFAPIVETLDREAAEAHARRTPIGAVRAGLAAARDDIADLDPAFDGRAALASALARAYRHGRKAMAAAETTLATHDIHRWRKAVKDLWHIVLVARARLPKPARRLAKRLDRLGDLLGRNNDHALLAEKLALAPDADHQLMNRLAVISQERHLLEAEAFALGGRVYRRRPKAFARRMKVR